MRPDQAAGLRRAGAGARSGDSFVAVVSGKGGVGKTNLVANLAVAAAGLRARVLLVDGDLGLANVDVLLGLVAPWSVEDVLAGRCALREALIDGPRGVKVLPAASGRPDLAALPEARIEQLMAQLRAAATAFDLVLVDAGAGVGPSVLGLAARCGRALVVTTPEPTSLADAYATLKVLVRGAPGLPLELVVNGVGNELAARAVHAKLERLTHRFLDAGVGFRGFLPRDERLTRAVALQRAVVELFPTAAASRQLVQLAQGLLRDHATRPTGPGPDRSIRPGGTGAPPCIRN